MAERTGLEPATPGVTGRYSNQLNYRSALVRLLSLNVKPGDVLLSHGEAPHYHRRYCVSLLSSAWSQVGPQCYGRQANSFSLFLENNLESCVLYTFNVLFESTTKPFGCCMVKPHGQLVQVSSTPHNAYTPCLSTF